MKKIVECVPNFSEGKRREIVDSIAAAMAGAPGVVLLDTEMDAAHNRCVISAAGEPEGIAQGVVQAVGKAIELIDLRQHRGEHPRMGAADVIPFIPISNTTIEECVDLSIRVAESIASRYSLPVYLYEYSARVPERRDLAYVRRGQFEAIREEIRTNPDRKPDFGPCEIHPSAGAVAVGARPPLIAYNIYLRSSDLRIAREIARAIRFSSGGLRYVKALAFEIKERNQVQVSINLTNYEETPVFRVFEMVKREAERYGVAVESSEIVGLIPRRALESSAAYFLRLESFSENQVLETRLAEALSREQSLDDFIASVAATDPLLPGGGSVSALAGSLGAALGEMVSSLTEGRPKYASVDARVREMHPKLTQLRHSLRMLVREDSAAFKSLMDAIKLPKDNEAQKQTRADAIERATRAATETPLQIARASAEALEYLRVLAESGNSNARSDAAAGAQMAFAALKGAQYNVLTNIKGIKDAAFAERSRREAYDLVRKGKETLSAIDNLFTGGE